MIKKIIFLLITVTAMSQTCPLIHTRSDSVVACKLRIRNLTAGLVKLNSNGNVSTATAGIDYPSASGASGQIAYFSGTSTLTSSTGFVWDPTNARIGISATPAAKIHTISSSQTQLRLGYDASNYFDAVIANTGSATFDLTGTNPIFTFNKFTLFSSIIATAANVNQANFSSTATGANATSTLSELLFGGASQVRYRISSRGNTQTTATANDGYAGFILGRAGYTEAPTGIHPHAATGRANTIFISNGAGATDTTSTFSVGSANTQGIGTNNYALHVDQGSSLIEGELGIKTNPNSSLHVGGSFALPYSEKTATYSIASTDHTINCTTNTFTVTLPTAVGITGRVYVIKNSGTGVITVATTSSQTIDGATTATISTQYSSINVQSTGSNWIIW